MISDCPVAVDHALRRIEDNHRASRRRHVPNAPSSSGAPSPAPLVRAERLVHVPGADQRARDFE
jgi:hypothetical protein